MVRPILESAAAKVDGEPCVTFVGNRSAGNYVKMVHNGIEYAMMQLIAEAYHLMKSALKLPDEKSEGIRNLERAERWVHI
jgi:6-phosphogluconate dehydrogenase